MSEQAVEIRTADGTADGFVFSPDGAARSPGVIHLTDIGGIRPAHRAMAERLAGAGFTVLLPNVFYRTGRPPMFDFQPKMGDERTMKRFAELAGPMTPQAQERDAAAYVDFLASHPAVGAGPVGVVGYCFTGGMAMRTAAVRPGKVAAAASFHGGGLYTDASTSPHLALPRVKARLYFGFAIEDRSMSEDAIAKLKGALESWGGKFEAETYDGAYHGWTSSDAPVYNQPLAERAFNKLTALLRDSLTR